MSDAVRSLLANLPHARFLPTPPGFIAVLRGYVPEERHAEVDAFVLAAGGSIEQAPRHDNPTMTTGFPSSSDIVAGEPYYVVPGSALER